METHLAITMFFKCDMTVLLIFVISSIFLKPIFLLVICEKSYNQNTSQSATSKFFLADAKKYLLIAETC